MTMDVNIHTRYAQLPKEQEIMIETTSYEDIKDTYADNYAADPHHYIVNHENGNIEYYIDIDVLYFAHDPLASEIKEVSDKYSKNFYFVYTPKNIDEFIDKYNYLFNNALIKNIFEIAYEMDKVRVQVQKL